MQGAQDASDGRSWACWLGAAWAVEWLKEMIEEVKRTTRMKSKFLDERQTAEAGGR